MALGYVRYPGQVQLAQSTLSPPLLHVATKGRPLAEGLSAHVSRFRRPICLACIGVKLIPMT